MIRPIPNNHKRWRKTMAFVLSIILCAEGNNIVTGEPQTAVNSTEIGTFSDAAQEWLEEEAKKTRLLVQGVAEITELSPAETQQYEDLSLFSFPSEQEAAAAYEVLSQQKGVFAEFDSVYEISDLEDPGESISETASLKGQTQIPTEPAAGREQVTIAVIDTGVDPDHPLLKGRVMPTIAVLAENPEQEKSDLNGHGTRVAALIADNTPKNVRLLPIKAAGADGRSTASALYLGISQAVKEQADIINISMNGLAGRNSVLVEEAIRNAIESGITVIVSAGNNSGNTAYYSPADLSSPIVTGAVDSKKNRSSFSNTGQTLDFVADGEDIAFQDQEGKTHSLSGTSYAAAFVSSAAARIKSVSPELSTAELEQELQKRAEDLGDAGWEEQYGHGYIPGLAKNGNDNAAEGEEQSESESETEAETEAETETEAEPEIEADPDPETGMELDHANLLSVSSWKGLDSAALQKLYANSSMEQISSFLQTNAADKDLIRSRIPALNGEIRIKDGTEDAYSFFERQQTGEYAVSAGRDLGNSYTGYFWFYLSCDSYYRPAHQNAAENHRESWYKIHIYNVSYQGTPNSSNSTSSSQRKYQVALEKIYQNGTPSQDYFDFYLRYNQSGSSDYGTRLETASAETEKGIINYSVYRIYASFIQREYHNADFQLVNWYEGKRLNTRVYDAANSGSQPNTLDEENFPVQDTRKDFVIQIHNGNTGQASRHIRETGAWVDDRIVHAVARIRMNPFTASAESTDYINGGDFHGTNIGRSGNTKSLMYPMTGARGSDWGTESPIPGYHFTSDTIQDFYGTLLSNLNVARYFSPNTYQIRYEGGISAEGSPYSSSHRYDTWGKLKENQFRYPVQVTYQITEDGALLPGVSDSQSLSRPFLAWQYLGASYQPGQSVRNLTIGNGTVLTMEALWGNASGIALSASSVFRRGYTLAAWKSQKNIQIRPGQDFQTDSNLVFQTIWTPGVFRIIMDNQGGDPGSGYTRQIYQKYANGYYKNAAASTSFTDNKIIIPEKFIPDESLEEGKRRMKFLGYYTLPDGRGFQVIDSAGKINQTIDGSGPYQYYAADSTVYAHWKEQKRIRYESNLMEKDLQLIGIEGYQMPENTWKESNATILLNYQPAAVTNNAVKEMYRFLGWSLTPEIRNADEIILSSAVPEKSFDMTEDLTFYGQWDSSYKLAFMGNEQTEGDDYLKDVEYFRDEYLFPGNEEDYFKKSENRPSIDIETGKATDLNGNPVMEAVSYTFRGWSMFYDYKIQSDKFVFQSDKLDVDAATFLKFAKEAADIEPGIGVTYGKPSKYYNQMREDNRKISIVNNGEMYPYINLFTVWDQYPQILASDLYIPLFKAQNGDITEKVLLEMAAATDRELIDDSSNPTGQMKLGEDTVQGTSFRIIDFSASDFTTAVDNQSFTVTYQAIDQTGNTARKTVTIYLVNSVVSQKIKAEIRFISKEYTDTLAKNSIWRTEKYNEVLLKVLNNMKSDLQYTSVKDYMTAVGVKPKLMEGSGKWDEFEQVWIFTKKDLTAVKEFVEQYGLGNKTDLFLQTYAANKIY